MGAALRVLSRASARRARCVRCAVGEHGAIVASDLPTADAARGDPRCDRVFGGGVLGAGVASATTRPESMTDCFANAFHHWQFMETPRGEVVVATVTLSVR